jgi:hypothetical protein
MSSTRKLASPNSREMNLRVEPLSIERAFRLKS